ncbi:MAG TPA: SDR family oxidoreductase [Spirochaetota bacterium]|nr:SDR family oxidoreductase [Spirochaetota bacterium]HPC40190.1 SDR family oxidoreductase [Spirochaetota bacterium]
MAADKGVYIVTGANAGIGKAIARKLALMGHQVVMVCRSMEKGEAARAEISAGAPGPVDLVQGDLADVESVHRLAGELLRRYRRIACLINNAGIWMQRREVNADGLEATFMVNHLAPFILTSLLMPRLRESAPARVVNIGAGLYVFGTADPERTPRGLDFSRSRTYADSKLCSLLVTLETARRIEGTGVTINAVHPGVIRTGLGDAPGPFGFLLRLMKRFAAAPEKGADAPVWLATSPDVDGVNGKFFMLRKEGKLTADARNEDLIKRFWDLSVKLGKLTDAL